jgi:hypothetical protein
MKILDVLKGRTPLVDVEWHYKKNKVSTVQCWILHPKHSWLFFEDGLFGTIYLLYQGSTAYFSLFQLHSPVRLEFFIYSKQKLKLMLANRSFLNFDFCLKAWHLLLATNAVNCILWRDWISLFLRKCLLLAKSG